MKRRFFSVFNLTLFAGLFVLFSSCSGLMRDTGSATFSISPEVLKTAINNASIGRINQNSFILSAEEDLDQEKEDFFDLEKLELTVSLLGKYQKTITNIYTMEEMEALSGGIQITFPDIPLGNSVTAEATISFIFTREEKEAKQLYYKGTSEAIKITPGNNPLTVVLKEYHPFLIKFYIEDETAKDTDVEGYKYDYYLEGSFNNYENFSEDFYKFIMNLKESEKERYQDYEYLEKWDSSFDENGTEVFRVFFEKKAVEPVMIYYEVYPYYQNENTTYDEDKTLSEQEDIFTKSNLMASGEVAEEKWEGDLKNVIVPKASLYVVEDYAYCGFALEENEDDPNFYIIKVYFKSTKIQEPVEPIFIDYVVHRYHQKENTTYDETKTLADQEEIFEFYDDAEYGDATPEEWKIKLVEDILVRAESNTSEDFIYCGYILEENGENDYIIKVFYKAAEKQPVEESANIRFNISVLIPEGYDESDDGEIVEEEQEEDGDYHNYKVIVTVSGNDDYTSTKEKVLTQSELEKGSAYIDFEKVPVGTISTDAILFISYLETDDESFAEVTRPFGRKEMESELSAGENTIQIALESYNPAVTSYIFKYYFADEKATDTEYPGYKENTSYEESGTCKDNQELNELLLEVAEKETTGYKVNKNRNVYTLDLDGLCIYKFFFDKAAEEPVEEKLAYEVYYYKQKSGTTYSEDLTPDKQSDIFDCTDLVEKGEILEDQMTTEQANLIQKHAQTAIEGYIYCGNSQSIGKDGLLHINFYFKLEEIVIEEPDPATAGFSIVLERVSTDEPVELKITDSSTETQVVLTTDQGYTSYKWFVNDKSYEPSPNGYELKFDLTKKELYPGVYYVTVTVKDSNGVYWTSDDYKLIVQY